MTWHISIIPFTVLSLIPKQYELFSHIILYFCSSLCSTSVAADCGLHQDWTAANRKKSN